VFIWTADHELAFRTLQQALISAPVLRLPDFFKQFCVKTDASDLGVGAVLMQQGHPIAYVSKSFGPKMRGLSTYERVSGCAVGCGAMEIISAVRGIHHLD
jgi:hypothetical protein